MNLVDSERRKLLKIMAGAAASQFYIPNLYGHNRKDKLIRKFGLTHKVDKNLEIVKRLSPENFHLLYRGIGFKKLRRLVENRKCSWYPRGYGRIKNMKNLLDLINSYSNEHNLSSYRIFSHIFVESGGYNNLNCEVGGGVMHLRDHHWDGINPLNERQNIQRGVEYISRLNEEFQNEDLASLSFNIGESRVRKYFSKVKNYFENKKIRRGPKYEEIIWSMERSSPYLASLGKNYMGLINKSWNFVKKRNLFFHDSKNNLVKYTGPEKFLK